jgi:hypothetical protein
VAGFTRHVAVLPDLSGPQSWLVRFRYSLSGEAPVVAQEIVEGVTCEATAIRDGITQRLGAVDRPLWSLEMLAVHPI